LRGLAALWVVLFHASEGGHIERLKSVLPPAFVRLVFDSGYLGVPVFFVLSGFVMALTVHSARVDLGFAFRFVLRRMVRLTPPYAVSIAIVIGFLALKMWALHTPVSFPSVGAVVAHVAYVQDVFGVPPLNPVYWTLAIEVQFYIFFAVLMLAADALSRWIPNARLWLFGLTGIVGLAWPAGIATTALWPGGFIPLWFSFAAGVLVCWGWRLRGWPEIAALVFCAAVLGLGNSAFAVTASVTAVTLLAAGRLGAMQSWLNWRWIQFLGSISYSLYLLHNPTMGAWARVARFSSGTLSDLLVLVSSVAVCILAAFLAYRWVEVPSQRWSGAIKLGRVQTAGDVRTAP